MASGDDALMTLIRSIADGDRPRVLAELDEHPALATAALDTGATRGGAADFFIEPISHYVYRGDTALHAAAAAHRSELISDLVQRGASVDATNRRGQSPLHYAADSAPGSAHWDPDAQRDTIVRLLAAGADPNAVDKNGVAPLHRAVRTRGAAAVRALIEGGADPAQPNGNGSTPLQLAESTTGKSGSGSEAARSQQAKIVELLTPR